MKIHSHKITLAAALMSLALPVLAQTGSEFGPNDEQEPLLIALAAHLTDDEGMFAIKATLRAPVTSYDVALTPEFERKIKETRDELYGTGIHVKTQLEDRPMFGGEKITWTGEVSCGAFEQLGNGARWTHPDGPPPNCPHEDGTSHQGTVSVEGAVYLYAVRYGTYDNYDHSTGPSLLQASWRVSCTYEGSESGYGPVCEQTLISWKGIDGVETLAPAQSPGILDDIEAAPEPRPGTWAALSAAALALAAATAYAVHRWGQKAKDDPKGGKQEAEARPDRW